MGRRRPGRRCRYLIPIPFPPIDLPPGFRLKSLAEDNDLQKIHRVLHRGFNHPGEPPPEGLAGRQKMRSGPLPIRPPGQPIGRIAQLRTARRQV